MTITLKLVFILTSLIAFVFVIQKIRKSQLQVVDAIMWIIGAILLVFISVFSDVVMSIAHLLGFYSASNFILSLFVFFLLLIVFMQNIKISTLSEKVKNLNHFIALDQKNREEKQEDTGNEN